GSTTSGPNACKYITDIDNAVVTYSCSGDIIVGCVAEIICKDGFVIYTNTTTVPNKKYNCTDMKEWKDTTTGVTLDENEAKGFCQLPTTTPTPFKGSTTSGPNACKYITDIDNAVVTYSCSGDIIVGCVAEIICKDGFVIYTNTTTVPNKKYNCTDMKEWKDTTTGVTLDENEAKGFCQLPTTTPTPFTGST
ncbi:hypothetical protein PMAYCL1PPCAC_17879, partial [Pristionchus mayeri]